MTGFFFAVRENFLEEIQKRCRKNYMGYKRQYLCHGRANCSPWEISGYALTSGGFIALRQYYLMRESLSRVLPMFAWVGIDMVLWG